MTEQEYDVRQYQETLFWSHVSHLRNECLQCFLIVKAQLLYKCCFRRASTSVVNTTDARFCPKRSTTWRNLGLSISIQEGCIYFMTMPPHTKLRKWETIWLITSQGFASPSLQPWTCPLCLFLLFPLLRKHMAGMKFTQCQHLAKKVNSQLRWVPNSKYKKYVRKYDPKAEAMNRSWRKVFWRTEIDIIWCMCNLNEIKTKWQKVSIHPHKTTGSFQNIITSLYVEC